jgi:hypothetical protein
MSVLEEKIKKNREHYDVHEPDTGHADRFGSRLDAEFHANEGGKRRRLSILRYAAGFLLIASLATILLIQYSGNSSTLKASPMNDELALVVDHYDRLADQKLGEISNCVESEEEAAKVDQIARDQIEKLEADASILKEELDKDAANQRVYGALVNNYRTRIKILDNIINRICEL